MLQLIQQLNKLHLYKKGKIERSSLTKERNTEDRDPLQHMKKHSHKIKLEKDHHKKKRKQIQMMPKSMTAYL